MSDTITRIKTNELDAVGDCMRRRSENTISAREQRRTREHKRRGAHALPASLTPEQCRLRQTSIQRQQMIHRLRTDEPARGSVLDGENAGLRQHVVVRGHRVAVRADGGHGQQVATCNVGR